MRIAVLSDIHDNIWNLETALDDVNERGAEALVFLGDFCAPFTLAQIGESFDGDVHAVFGNNDGDELELGGKRIALNHYPDLARRLAESGAYDAVFSGHNHERQHETIGGTLWANPGEVMGRFGSPSYGLYDTETNTFEHVDIE